MQRMHCKEAPQCQLKVNTEARMWVCSSRVCDRSLTANWCCEFQTFGASGVVPSGARGPAPKYFQKMKNGFPTIRVRLRSTMLHSCLSDLMVRGCSRKFLFVGTLLLPFTFPFRFPFPSLFPFPLHSHSSLSLDPFAISPL